MIMLWDLVGILSVICLLGPFKVSLSFSLNQLLFLLLLPIPPIPHMSLKTLIKYYTAFFNNFVLWKSNLNIASERIIETIRRGKGVNYLEIFEH